MNSPIAPSPIAEPDGDGTSESSPALAEAFALPDDVLGGLGIDVAALQGDLAAVAAQAHEARREGISLAAAVADPRFESLARFHTDLRDALLVEIPAKMKGFVEATAQPNPGDSAAGAFAQALTDVARGAPPRPVQTETAPVDDDGNGDGDDDFTPAEALAELLVFEAVRLRLLVASWQNEEFERLGGSESDIDAIAAHEVETLLAHPALDDDEVRPLTLMVAAASMSLAADAADRATALRRVGDDTREELAMQARLRTALRKLRLPESVLLGNALSGLLGEQRLELPDLQKERPVALGGMSRQAMDQRVSRGRKALTRPPEAWPRRKRAALLDLLSDNED